MRRMIVAVAIVARCRAYSIHVLNKDSGVTGAQLCQYSSCLPWLCLFDCSNGRRSAIRQFDELLSMTVLTTSWWMLLIDDL